MNSGKVPEELQGLTEIGEALIAQLFPVMSVSQTLWGTIWIPWKCNKFSSRCMRVYHATSLTTIINKFTNSSSTVRKFRGTLTFVVIKLLVHYIDWKQTIVTMLKLSFIMKFTCWWLNRGPASKGSNQWMMKMVI